MKIFLLFLFLIFQIQAQQQPTCQCAPENPGCCTFTRSFWRNHHNFANGAQQISWPLNCAQQNVIHPENNTIFANTAGQTQWLLLLSLPTSGDACIQGAAQWIAATLNICNGACTDPNVIAALQVANNILTNTTLCPGLTPNTPFQAERNALILAKNVLDSYNNGFIGPGHCDEEPPDCPEFRCEGGCTRTQDYWKTHDKFERKRPKRIPWPEECREPPAECTELNNLFPDSDLTWLQILENPSASNEDFCLILAKQWIAAKLNQCSGACVPSPLVTNALEDAFNLMQQWCLEPGLPAPGQVPDISDSQRRARERAQLLYLILEGFNSGFLIGPGNCDLLENNGNSVELGEDGNNFELLTTSELKTLRAILILVIVVLGVLVIAILAMLFMYYIMKPFYKSRTGNFYKKVEQ